MNLNYARRSTHDAVRLNKRGVALLEALILVVLISLTGAAVLTLTLGGFIGSAGVSVSQTNKFDAMSILSRVYADLAVCDPESDGTFITDNCSLPLPGWCTSTSDSSKCWANLSGLPATNPTSNITYDLTVGQASSRDASVGIRWCSATSQYKIGITPCDSPGCSAPTVSCP